MQDATFLQSQRLSAGQMYGDLDADRLVHCHFEEVRVQDAARNWINLKVSQEGRTIRFGLRPIDGDGNERGGSGLGAQNLNKFFRLDGSNRHSPCPYNTAGTRPARRS